MKAPRAAAIGATIAGILVGFGAGQASAGLDLGHMASDAAPATSQIVVAEQCSAQKDDYSANGRWSSVTHRICASAVKKADGAVVVTARWTADMTYYWGAAWYTEKCPDVEYGSCFAGGELQLRKAGDWAVEPHDRRPFGARKIVNTGHVEYTTTWTAKPGTAYEIGLSRGRKQGGYWHQQGSSQAQHSVVELERVPVKITTPS